MPSAPTTPTARRQRTTTGNLRECRGRSLPSCMCLCYATLTGVSSQGTASVKRCSHCIMVQHILIQSANKTAIYVATGSCIRWHTAGQVGNTGALDFWTVRAWFCPQSISSACLWRTVLPSRMTVSARCDSASRTYNISSYSVRNMCSKLVYLSPEARGVLTASHAPGKHLHPRSCNHHLKVLPGGVSKPQARNAVGELSVTFLLCVEHELLATIT